MQTPAWHRRQGQHGPGTSWIKAHLLCLNVDLLWNGGIGTYVKSARESDADVGIAATTCCGSMAATCVCIVARVATLASTQLGRVEYARAQGRINTDFTDNVGGRIVRTTRSPSRSLLNQLAAAG